jgi:drug/metabolite transporter (DMT)-like permease
VSAAVPRVGSTHAMVLSVIVLWALNLTMSRYVIKHGFQPLAYSTVRYGGAVVIFLLITIAVERGVLLARRDWRIALAAAAAIVANQVAFVYALDHATASTVGLILGATPVFTALAGLAVGLERVGRRFWGAALVSFAGVALVAVGAHGEVNADVLGLVLAVVTAATWALYSVAVAPLMRRYSPYRVSAVVLSLGWVGIATIGARQVSNQDFHLGWKVWALIVAATLGPLVLTNVLWFKTLHRIGPARATLAVNLQPFVAAVFAVVLLDEQMTVVQVAGGLLVGVGILLAQRRRPTPQGPAAD